MMHTRIALDVSPIRQRKFMPSTESFSKLDNALKNLKSDGVLVRGTGLLVEAVKDHLNWSYAQVAKKANVSVPGLTRWRTRDAGEAVRVEPLIVLAKHLNGESPEERNEAEEGPGDELSTIEAIKALSLRQIEDHLSKSLEMLLPGHLLDCSILGLKFDEKSATLEIQLS
jgi:hypothetical protein